MLDWLPDFLDGLFNMLSDQNREIRQAADSALAEFLRETKLSAVTIETQRMILKNTLILNISSGGRVWANGFHPGGPVQQQGTIQPPHCD